jgi:anti-sigma factor RsiW
MTTYIGCETARTLIDSFVDGELPVGEQVTLESHLRWCGACAARVDDLRLIGDALRTSQVTASPDDGENQALASIQAGVLTRIRAERDQSLRSRTKELFVDMRLLWPAFGATVAVIIGMAGASSVMQRMSFQERPDSLAGMIDIIANPGSDRNPLRLDNRISIPRMLDDGDALDGIPQDDAVFAVATVVTREGRIANYELLESNRSSDVRNAASHATHVAAVLDAVKQSRFAPAQTEQGQPVAVNMVWLILRTTASGDAQLEQLLKAVPRPRQFVPSHPPARIESRTANEHSSTA